ncbi:PREDICTED: uncharacterized protein LOC105456969 [Wasmannia auropunctata]|uniref:uncharacterized protein LOC105456969 n=1 Tax=Wasmannia auropunctata TaxID=64793 RepID=UPI0005EEFF08|nr:PREDICTED: uncharacterized protein LOC105456969 [Wasmannia auropunctata]
MTDADFKVKFCIDKIKIRAEQSRAEQQQTKTLKLFGGRDECLNNNHIDYFGLLLKNCSEYHPRESWRIHCPDTIEPVSEDQEHIQILYSCNDIKTNINGHWVCSYYNTKTIYIYDSLNLKWLHVHHKIYLEKLYPFYTFEKKSIQFPKVQEQSNKNDSGVFAIAFAVSLLFGLQPNTIMYDHSLMRQHLTQIFQSNKIEHFPRIIRPADPKQLFSLEEVQKRKLLAKKQRKFRLEKREEKKSTNIC